MFRPASRQGTVPSRGPKRRRSRGGTQKWDPSLVKKGFVRASESEREREIERERESENVTRRGQNVMNVTECTKAF